MSNAAIVVIAHLTVRSIVIAVDKVSLGGVVIATISPQDQRSVHLVVLFLAGVDACGAGAEPVMSQPGLLFRSALRGRSKEGDKRLT